MSPDLDYLSAFQHGDHEYPLNVEATTGYGDIPGCGTYKLTCPKCGSSPLDPLAGVEFGISHADVYTQEWGRVVPESCEQAARENSVKEIMES